MSDEPDIVNVTSHNQQGGITAYQVNIQQGDRVLNKASTDFLEAKLAEYKPTFVEVTAVMGDQEAFRLARQIKNFLVDKGFTVKGVNQGMYTEPIQGVVLNEPDANALVKIVVGGR